MSSASTTSPVDTIEEAAGSNHATTNHGDGTVESPLPPQPSQTGIDVRKALEILSARTPHEHEHHGESKGTNGETPECCHEGRDLPEDVKKMGQTIDLMQPSTSSSTTATTKTKQALAEAEQRRKIQAEQNKAELYSSLKTVTNTSDLIRMVLRAQEDRVQTYRRYDSALQSVLETGNLTAYPPACASATASFSVLSETIKAVREELVARRSGSGGSNSENVQQYVEWIQDLQSLEREKLQWTAALHLEKIRARNQQEELRHVSKNKQDDAAEDSSGEDRVLGLLKEGIANLEHKIEKCVGDINLVLDDLRCALMEEMEEDEA